MIRVELELKKWTTSKECCSICSIIFSSSIIIIIGHCSCSSLSADEIRLKLLQRGELGRSCFDFIYHHVSHISLHSSMQQLDAQRGWREKLHPKQPILDPGRQQSATSATSSFTSRESGSTHSTRVASVQNAFSIIASSTYSKSVHKREWFKRQYQDD